MRKLKAYTKSWRVRWSIGGLFVVGALAIFFLRKNAGTAEILIVRPRDFVQQVSVSGKVVAAHHVDLAFSQGGRVSAVYREVGDRVVSGTVLASVENGDFRADVLQKEALRDGAMADLASLRQGTRPEELAVVRSGVDSAYTALYQATQSLLDAGETAYTQSDDAVRRRVDQFISNPRSADPRLNFRADETLRSGVEAGRVQMESLLVSWRAMLDVPSVSLDVSASSGADVASKNLTRVRGFLDMVAFAVNGLRPSSGTSQATIDGYAADITTARTNINTSIAALTSAVTAGRSAGDALATAESNLTLKEAGPREEDITAKEAHVKATEADLENARAKLEKSIVRAPFTGVVTRMDAKVGGIASANSSAISLVSTDTLEIESYVPEINIRFIKVGDSSDVTLDAYGLSVAFHARVTSIDPAETVRDGVSTYRVRLQFAGEDTRVKPGMTANVLITTEKKSHVIAVPQGIVVVHDDASFVSVKKGATVVEQKVETGAVSSLGEIEILSGLREGDTVLLNMPVK